MTDTNIPELNTWQEETVEVPATKMGEDGRVVHTTEKRTRRYMLTPLTPHQICAPDQHYFEFVDGGRRQDGRVLVKCKQCPLGRQFVVGKHQMRDGKLFT